MTKTPTAGSSLVCGIVPKSIRFAAVAVGILGAGLAACSAPPGQSSRTVAEKDPVLGVKPSPRVVAVGKPAPKGGGVYRVGAPYQVAGTEYSPFSRPDYTATGMASWYGDEFHGRLTANGEVYDRNALSAAHPTLPLPSYVRVTNVTNGRSIVVRVNDRGPFSRSRLIDVSARTADVLGFRRAGVARVKVDYIGVASLKGSDDRKLLATYSTNGDAGLSPEQFRIASAPPPPAPPAPRYSDLPPAPPAPRYPAPQASLREPLPAHPAQTGSISEALPQPRVSAAQRIASSWSGLPAPMPLAPVRRDAPQGVLALTPTY
jgi:rare lipoprotein A